MGVYSNSARGIYLDDTMTVDASKVKNIDFIIADGGYANVPSKKFTDWVQLAYNLDIPIIMKYKVYCDGGYEYNLGNLSTGFPGYAEDLQMVAMKRQVFMGTTKRKVAGLMLDMTDNTYHDGSGRVEPEGNFANLGKFFWSACWSELKLPQYVFMNQSMFDTYKSAPGLEAWISKVDALCSWKSATPGAQTVQASWSAIPVPPDDYKPQYISNAPAVYFSKYANSAYTFDGITPGSVPLYIYKGGKSQLYSDLGFSPRFSTPPVIVTPPVVTPPVVTPPVVVTPTPVVTVDLSGVLAKLDAITSKVDALAVKVSALEAKIVPADTSLVSTVASKVDALYTYLTAHIK